MEEFAFMLMPGFSAIAFFAAIEPLRIANRLSSTRLYAWSLHAPSGTDGEASNGMQIRTDGPLAGNCTTLIVCAGFDPLGAASPRVMGQIRRIWRRGGTIGAIDTGAFVLAEAAILGHEPVTLHWEAASEFRLSYPRIPVSDELYESHARLFTCAGGTAAMDMMLDRIAASHGLALANAVSDQLIHERIRPPNAPQRISAQGRFALCGAQIRRLIAAMERAVVLGTPLERVLDQAAISRRHAERLMHEQLGTTPGRFYRELRLRHGLDLMRGAGLAVSEAALAAGFSSAPVFSRACSQHFGSSPREMLARER